MAEQSASTKLYVLTYLLPLKWRPYVASFPKEREGIHMPHDYAGLLASAKEIIDGNNASGASPIDYERFVQGL